MVDCIGMDIHRKWSQVWVLNPRGKEEQAVRLHHGDVGRVREFFQQFEPGTAVVMEATVGWMWLADLLQELDLDVHLAHSAGVKLIAASRLKTDKVDAHTLAQLLRTGFLPEAYLAPTEVRNQRVLLRFRQGLVKLQTMVKNRVHAILIRWNVALEMTDLFGAKGMEQLRAMKLPQPWHRVFHEWLKLLEHLRRRLKETERAILREIGDDREARLLRSLPGVGQVLSFVIRAEIGQIERFASDRHLASYAALVPKTYQSGEKTRQGSLVSGNQTLQWALVEAAQTAVRRDSYFARLYQRHKSKRGHGHAIVAVAHQMARILWHLLKEQRAYRPLRLQRNSPVGPTHPMAVGARG